MILETPPWFSAVDTIYFASGFQSMLDPATAASLRSDPPNGDISIRLLSRTNAIERPSGDHFGKESSAASVVNRCGSAAESATFT